MDNKEESNRHIAVLILRVLLGLIFLMAGYGKVFKIGTETIYLDMLNQFQNTFLPKSLIWATAYYTSYIELICGFLSLFGIFKNISLYFLGSVLIIISFGHGLIDPIWDLHHLFFRAVFLVTLLLLPADWDKYSVDAFLLNFRKIKKI